MLFELVSDDLSFLLEPYDIYSKCSDSVRTLVHASL